MYYGYNRTSNLLLLRPWPSSSPRSIWLSNCTSCTSMRIRQLRLQFHQQEQQAQRKQHCYHYSSNNRPTNATNGKRNNQRRNNPLKSKSKSKSTKQPKSMPLSKPKSKPRSHPPNHNHHNHNETFLARVSSLLTQPLKNVRTPGGKQFISSPSFYSLFSFSGKGNSKSNSTLAIASKRLPLYILLMYIIQDEELSPVPFTFDCMNGPSMLPTIYPLGECYVRLRPRPIWWNRITYFFSSDTSPNNNNGNDDAGDNDDDNGNNICCDKSCRIKCNVGDIVTIKDYKGRYACKRIIGVGGDAVWRYGEFATELYSDDKRFGVPEIHINANANTNTNNSVPKVQLPAPWEDDIEMIPLRENSPLWTKIVVPEGHIWVEGDNPLFSIDSRHYGPVALENVCGRIVYRLWPRVRGRGKGRVETASNGKVNKSGNEGQELDKDSCFISRNRPRPLTEDEMIKGPYGVVRHDGQSVER